MQEEKKKTEADLTLAREIQQNEIPNEFPAFPNRTDFDLSNHEKLSGSTLGYLDPETNKRFIPYVIEPSVGVERLFYAIVCDSYEVEELEKGETREVLHLPYALCPYKAAVLPLSNKLNDNAYYETDLSGDRIVFRLSSKMFKYYNKVCKKNEESIISDFLTLGISYPMYFLI